ncbi:MAG: AraC family transcriptional regulator [Lentisphaeria bacterium]|nr:AraC family transcriptional regulator [Lentisphaeria bacterium]
MPDTLIRNYNWDCPLTLRVAGEGCPINVAKDFYSKKPLALHTHDFLEIAIIGGGNGFYATATENFSIRRGDVFLIPCNYAHRYYPPNSLLVYNVLLQNNEVIRGFPELLVEPALRCFLDMEPRFHQRYKFQYLLHLSEEELQTLVGYWQLMNWENLNRGPHYVTIMHSLLRCLLAQLCRFFSEKVKETENEMLKMAEVLRHIELHFGEPIFCQELAKIYGKPRKLFTADFQLATGKVPRDYLLQFRLEKAREMLQNTSLLAKEISIRCGFCEPCYFTQCFKKFYGKSPSAFRKK